MNATPTQPDSNEREELARLLPVPVERDLPSDRHQRLQEFVMSQIHQDLRSAELPPHPSPRRRRLLLTSTLTAVTATAVTAAAIGAAVIGAGDSGSTKGGSDTPAVTTMSGQQILLAAAAAAERAPEGSGTYWYIKVVSEDSKRGPSHWETWTLRDGKNWLKKGNGSNPIEVPDSSGFNLGGPKVSFEQLQRLPTEPGALKSWITDLVKHSDVGSSAGRLTPEEQERAVFYGLVSLICQLPAPPNVRAAAFRAIASYPNVKSLGPVDGGQGLQFEELFGEAARLVVDPASSQVRKSNFFVSLDGGRHYKGSDAGSDSFIFVAEWTNLPPR